MKRPVKKNEENSNESSGFPVRSCEEYDLKLQLDEEDIDTDSVCKSNFEDDLNTSETSSYVRIWYFKNY